jgi:lambda family phage tail tape measure protein
LLAARDKIAAQLQINVLTEREVGFQKILADDAKRRADAEKATARAVTGNSVRIADGLDRQREQYDDRLGVVGLGSQAAEELRSRQQVEREYSRMQAQLTKTAAENATLEGEAYKQGTRDIAAAREQALGINEAYYTRLRQMQGDWSLGAAQAIANYRDESANVFKQVEQLTTNAFKGMEDALVSFATTGKADFKGLANSIIADLVRIQVRASITSAIGGSGGGLSSLIGSLSGGLSGSSAASVANVIGGSDKLGSMIGLMGLTKNALGGVYQSPSLSSYSNQVYDKPQLFAFAKGGVFAEEGPEAIMPLRRGADGRLGVASSGGGMGDVIIHNYAGANVEAKRTPDGKGGFNMEVFVREVGDHIEGRIAENISSGIGPAPRAIEGRYGLQTAVS